MIDIKLIREQTDIVKKGISKKKFDCDLDLVLQLDSKRRKIITEVEQIRAQQKSANSEMAKLPKGAPEFLQKVKELKELSNTFKSLNTDQLKIEEDWQNALLTIPNIPHESVPVGDSEDDNKEIRTWGDIDKLVSADAVPHYDIPWLKNLIDFDNGVKVTGAGFPFFKGDIARLVRGLIQFFLDEANTSGYIEIMPPVLVNADSATATGQLPDKEGQMYYVTNDELYLIPTAEVPVTNLYRDEIFKMDELPIKHCAYTPCFRREAGSYGKDVRGLNRLHQFDKVELVKWVHPESSFDEQDKMLAEIEGLLQKLALPYRVLLMCSGDIGFPHAKQYDVEVWAGGQKRWLEVSSCSNFTDFQARRANIRFRDENNKPRPVHTLNGSALAIPRVLAAIIENNFSSENGIQIPNELVAILGNEYIKML